METFVPRQPALPPEVLHALGAELGAVYKSWCHQLPPDLVVLARRVILDVGEKHQADFQSPPASFFDKSLYDPLTIGILDQALNRAWSDLQSVNHPASKETLAKCLCQLLRTERNPARLATKAVIKIILPPESLSSHLPG